MTEQAAAALSNLTESDLGNIWFGNVTPEAASGYTQPITGPNWTIEQASGTDHPAWLVTLNLPESATSFPTSTQIPGIGVTANPGPGYTTVRTQVQNITKSTSGNIPLSVSFYVYLNSESHGGLRYWGFSFVALWLDSESGS